MAGPGRLVLLSFLFSLIVSVVGVERIKIIDDADDKSDPSLRTSLSFYPVKNGHWNDNGGCSAASPFCLHPDVSKTQAGTWTSTALFYTEEQRKITIEFIGDVISVFFTLVGKGHANYTTRCTFVLDGKEVSELERVPFPSDGDDIVEFKYKEKIFDQHDLEQGPHRLEIVIPGFKQAPNYLNFDYAEYRFDDAILQLSSSPSVPMHQASASTSYASPTGSGSLSTTGLTKSGPGKGVMQAAIIGGCVSGAILVLSIVLFLIYRARRRARGPPSDRLTFGVPSTYAGSTKKLSIPFWPHKPAYDDNSSNFRHLTPYPEKRRSDTSYSSSKYTEKYPKYAFEHDAKQHGHNHSDRASTISHGPILSPANALIQSFYPNRNNKHESGTTGMLSRLDDGMSPASSFPRHLSTFSDVRAQQAIPRTPDTGITKSSDGILPQQSPSSFGAGSQTPQSYYGI